MPITSPLDKRTKLLLILTGIFITNAVLAEIIGPKIFSFEQSLGISPARISIFKGFILDFNLSAGVLLWPVVFITTDVINEYFGKKVVREISFLAASLIFYVFIIIWIVTKLAPSDLWLDQYPYDSKGNPLNISESFNYIFTQGLGIIIGSIVAFLIGQLLDVVIFQKIRQLTKGKKIWIRATGSTLISQLIDSFIVLFIAFYIFGRMSLKEVFALGIINYIYKFTIAILLTPLIYLAHYYIDKYLGKDLSKRMTNEASKETLFN